MSKILIKVLNESAESLGHLHLDGINGQPYLFHWNKELLSYCYLPAGQEEIDDIFATMSLPNFPWRFVPVIVDDAHGTAKQIAYQPKPYVPRDRYVRHTIEDLKALCEDCGMVPCADDSERLLVQIDAYMLGRGVAEKIKKDGPPPKAPAPVPAEADLAPV